ncbi:MAG: ATP-binding cassette domain-containing protein [Alphaproteobacteria bacterium]|nr:ATP-binding cassette domain-containing protein [Alphaproteobacteria bacterium]
MQVTNLTKKHGDELIIADASFALEPGKVTCLLGASGAGKTTILKILGGLDNDYSGTIESALARPSAAIGYLSQNDKFLPWRSVHANVALGLELTGQHRKEAFIKAEETLARLHLSDFQKKMPHQISGGMLQKALLARTLALEPKLLLLDEPMSNMDMLARQEYARMIRDYIISTKSTGLIVTHSIEEACILADNVYILSAKPARIIAEIQRNDAYEDYVAKVTAALMKALQ